MPLSPQLPAWAGPAPATQTNIVDMQRQIAQLMANMPMIPPGGIVAGQIADGAITSAAIQAGSITAGDIAAGTITAAQIAAHTITAGQIAANTITAGQIAADSITSTELAANSVTANEIAANSINAAAIQAGAIGTAQLASGSVTADKIQAGAINASTLGITSLSAITANMGTLTSGIIQTASTGSRLLIGTGLTTPSGVTDGIVGIDTGNNVTFSMDADTGNVVLKGNIISGSTGLGNIGGVTQNGVTIVYGGNLPPNPSFTGTGIDAYVNNNATLTRDATTFLTQPASLKMVSTVSGSYGVNVFNDGVNGKIPVTASTTYSVGTYILNGGAKSATIAIAWYNSSGTLISTSTSSTFTTIPNQWIRVTNENMTSPGTATKAVIQLRVTGTAVGDTTWVDNFVFANQPVATGAQIVVDSITAAELNVGQLSAITADLGTVTAGILSAVTINGATINGVNITGTATITGATITGGLIQSSTTHPKTAFDSTGFYITDSGTVKRMQITTNGVNFYPPDASSNYGPANLTWWQSSNVGLQISSLIASASTSQMLLNAIAPGQSPDGTAWPYQYSELNVYAPIVGSATAPGIIASAHNNGSGAPIHAVKLIDGNGNTDLVRNYATNQDTSLYAFVTSGTMPTWNTGTWISLAINHGTARQPVACFGSFYPGGALESDFFVVTSYCDTGVAQFYAYNDSPFNVSGTYNFGVVLAFNGPI